MVCPHTGHDFESILEVYLPPGDPLLKAAVQQGEETALRVHGASPAGTIRSPEVRKRACILGSIAEHVVNELLNQYIARKKINAKITSSGLFRVQEEGQTQIDLELTVGDKSLEIEIRSSCVRNPIKWAVTHPKGFDIIGWYTTKVKSKEVRKDFYLRVLYNFDQTETMEHVANGITLYFVGGASKPLLQGSKGYDGSLDQSGANYRLIKPICAARDARQILEEIFSS
jgi:hypothetical protein